VDVPEKVRYASQRLKDGYRVNRITVRDFLGHVGVERRGGVKVAEIRKILEALGLRTEPDFETVWIEEPIWLRLKDDIRPPEVAFSDECEFDRDQSVDHSEENVLESTPSAVRQVLEQNESAPTSPGPEAAPDRDDEGESYDPTFRIGSLPAANKTLVVVNQNDSINMAITLMLQHDFSQLPVMQGEREVKGMITWKSICSRLALGSNTNGVRP